MSMIDTQEMKGNASCRLTATATAITQKGIMIQVSTGTGLASKASASASQRVVGVNLNTCLASGKIVANSGIFRFDNSVSQPVTDAYVGANCYVEDEHTVAISASNSNVAGKVVQVDANGVYVKVGIK